MEKTIQQGPIQYLSFKLADEIYAVEVTKVREILEFVPITKVPRTPDSLRGVINLRGSVVPVIDMRLKFGMPQTEKTVNTCIVVVDVQLEGESTIIGILTDMVQEVIEMESSQIEPPPRFGSKLKVDFLRGMGKIGDPFQMILDLDRIFSADELGVAKDLVRNPEGLNLSLESGK